MTSGSKKDQAAFRRDRRQEAFPDDMRNHMRAIAGPGLQSDVLDVPFHRARCDIQLLCRFFGRHADRNEPQDFGFPPRKLGEFNYLPRHMIIPPYCDHRPLR